ncbi:MULTISPECIES: YbaK/EbsC family protein [unclassified Motilimonas]|uniref:aminoacyl-tRNA deacylase n=1 Tax=Motilimonas TaxID=1914248 RepID=UPI001E2DCBD9|nr:MULTISPECIES: YbaK/EbsC family protein [unclassified Motilimonas]MCE0558444.1 YbaK/EbsC family protein [Motilimonas sp. E26]MDO6526584.1 YbaK/EbsC family protein [Motilimonas sp. 1_MG-2023]
MIQAKLQALFELNQISYYIGEFDPAYTSQHRAQSAHISGYELAKAVIVNLDAQLAMVVVPAPYKLDVEELAPELNAERILIACEEEFMPYFSQCESGAVPPLGPLFHLPVYMAADFELQPWIYFNGGNHQEMIKMKTVDFIGLVSPVMIENGFYLAGDEHAKWREQLRFHRHSSLLH